jgi:hypothetical protein
LLYEGHADVALSMTPIAPLGGYRAAAKVHTNGAFVRSEHGGLHADEASVCMCPTCEQTANMGGDALAPECRRKIVGDLGTAVFRVKPCESRSCLRADRSTGARWQNERALTAPRPWKTTRSGRAHRPTGGSSLCARRRPDRTTSCTRPECPQQRLASVTQARASTRAWIQTARQSDLYRSKRFTAVQVSTGRTPRRSASESRP